MRRVLIVASLLASSASIALVAQQGYRFLSDSPGVWKPWTFRADGDARRVTGAGPADVKEIEAQLLRLNAIIKKTAGMTNPIGFSIETSGQLEIGEATWEASPGAPALKVRPLASVLAFGPFPVMLYDSGKRVDTGEEPHVYFNINQLGGALTAATNSRVPEFEKIDYLDVTRLAAPQPDMFGWQRYGDNLVVRKSTAPLFVPVTFSETMDLVVRAVDLRLAADRDMLGRAQQGYDNATDPKQREARMAQYRKLAPQVKDPAYLEKMTKAEDEIAKRAGKEFLPQIANAKAVVAKTEQELAAVKTMAAGLSAADKAAPACYASKEAVSLSRFKRAPSAGCEALVRPNWKLFNPALPRTAPQLLTISGFIPRCLNEERRKVHVGGCAANLRLLQGIDKAALMAWLQ